jgi:serine phosphatase RsbU (regulator of sigma subunit)
MRIVNRATGVEQWLMLKSTPVRDQAGAVDAAVTVIEDVTAAKRTQLRTAFLARASQILASSLDYQRTLRNVANLAVPELADWCAVDLVDDQGRRQQVVVAHADPAKFAIAERIRQLGNPDLDPEEEGLGRVVATGRAELLEEIPEELLRERAESEEQLELLLQLGMRSAVLLPMTAGGRTLGVLTLVTAESGRRFTEDDLDFGLQIAERAAVAVENSRLYTERARVAVTLQRSLLPDALPAIPGWDCATLYRPAGDGMEVGGDFYDVFAVDDAWIAVIGDVTGKGVEAAAMTSLVRHSARIVAEDDPHPARILRRLDRVLRRQPELAVCSALCLRIDARGVTVSSAGHPLPLIVGEDRVAVAGRPGTLLGAFPDGRWEDTRVALDAGESLLLYTDGVTDTVGDAGRFGDERLRALAADAGGLPAAELLARLDDALNRFQVGPQADDTAALAFRLVATPASAAGDLDDRAATV